MSAKAFEHCSRCFPLRLGLWTCMWSWKYCQCQHTDLSHEVSWNRCRRGGFETKTCVLFFLRDEEFLKNICFFDNNKLMIQANKKRSNPHFLFFFVHFLWRFLSYHNNLFVGHKKPTRGKIGEPTPKTFQSTERYTPVSTNIAGWKMDPD